MPSSSISTSIASHILSKVDSRVLRLNVGFVLKEGVGYSRDFPFDAGVHAGEDALLHKDRVELVESLQIGVTLAPDCAKRDPAGDSSAQIDVRIKSVVDGR